MSPDPNITAALRAPAPGEGASALAVSLYASLQQCLVDYRAAVASSQSFEGSSISLAADTAGKQVAEYYAAYMAELAAVEIPAGQNPALLATPRGWGFRHDFIALSV